MEALKNKKRRSSPAFIKQGTDWTLAMIRASNDRPATAGALVQTVKDLLASAPSYEALHMRQSAPVWIPRNGHDSNGVPFIVLTCTECLRSFPVSVIREDLQSVQETACLFCPSTVRYII